MHAGLVKEVTRLQTEVQALERENEHLKEMLTQRADELFARRRFVHCPVCDELQIWRTASGEYICVNDHHFWFKEGPEIPDPSS